MNQKQHKCCNHEGNCCDHDHNEEFMTLLLEDDKELKCSVLEIFEVEGHEYIALLPIEQDEVLVYRYIEHDDDNFELSNIESDDEFEKIQNAFLEMFNEQNFDEC